MRTYSILLVLVLALVAAPKALVDYRLHLNKGQPEGIIVLMGLH
jgi:hypothetical protein